jgi:hypothetical protein
MSGIDDPDAPDATPPEVPEEYAAVYRDAYLRALQEDGGELAPAPADGSEDGSEVIVAPAATRPGRGRLLPVIVAGTVLLLLGAFVVAKIATGDDEPAAGSNPTTPSPTRTTGSGQGEPTSTPSETPDEPASSPAAVDGAWDGPVVSISPDQVEATCTAAPGVDSAGDPVVYDAANTLDGDPSTAWRCNGRGRGQVLTLTLPEDTAVAEVGLIPGYAKTDAKSGVDRYAENNRITRVRWTLADGVTVEQELDPSPTDRSVQRIRVPRTETGSITLEVLSVERGPRNTVAISEVEVAAAG